MKSTSKKYIQIIIKAFLVLIWMAIVFYFSSQSAQNSDKTSIGITEKILSIFIKNRTKRQEVILKFNPMVRKMAHFVLYTIGGMLILNFIHIFNISEKHKLLYSIFLGTIYAASDEIHQLFIEGRGGQVTDVILDAMGVATGVCIFLCVIKIVRGSKSENDKKV